MRTWMKFAAISLLGLALVQAAPAQPPQKSRAGAANLATGSKAGAQMALPASNDPSYVIGPTDVLDISVWKEPDFTRTVPVRPDGKISLPLLNDLEAAGLTPMKLATEITERLKKYVNDPQVTVIVTAINSQHVYVVGEVTRAGAFPLLPNMTVLQALSGAGGFTQFADLKNIHVLRTESGRAVNYPFNYKEVIKGRHSDQDILLKPGDTIVVP
jgi:polysaccharide export outer membrane protein